MGSVATTVVDAQLKPEVNAAPVPPAPKIEPAPKKKTEPKPEPVPEPNVAEGDHEHSAHPTAARRVLNKYLAFFHNDRDAAKKAMDKTTGGRPSKDWTALTLVELEDQLVKIERECAPVKQTAQVSDWAVPPVDADADDTAEIAANVAAEADARRIAEEEAAAWL